MLAPLVFDPAAAARDRILAAAQRLFYQQGIRATGVDRVIAEAGVTKVTFYRHFPAKNQLIAAALEQRHQRWMQGFQQALAQRPDAFDYAWLADAYDRMHRPEEAAKMRREGLLLTLKNNPNA